MKWIGLTGGLGTGKSTVAGLFQKHGIPVIDADRIAREVTEINGPAYPKILQAFGPGVLNQDKTLNRNSLAKIIFANPEKRILLERIIHPLVQEEVARQRQWLKDQGTAWALYDVPLLFEKNLKNLFDAVIVVSVTDAKTQIARIKLRNSWNDEEIQKRLSSQLNLDEKVKQADYVIQNDADLTTLEKKVAAMVQLLNDRFE